MSTRADLASPSPVTRAAPDLLTPRKPVASVAPVASHTPAQRPVDEPPRDLPSPPDLASAGAHLGLKVWRSQTGRGGFHYADAGPFRVTAGLPWAAPSDLQALYREFTAACVAERRTPLHFGLTDAALEFLIPSSVGGGRGGACSRWHVGDLPVYELSRWREEAAVPPAVLAQVRRARNRGITVVHWPHPPRDASRLADLERARAAWLRGKPLPPLVFMTTPFLFEPWPREGVFVALAGAAVVGFLVPSRVLLGDMLRVDAVARVPGAPNGTAESLVHAAFRHAAARGVRRATLGLAPLAGRSGIRQGGWLGMVSGCARRFGDPFYSFAGLEAFKAKFSPEAWIPFYCVAPGRVIAPRDVRAVARAFAGGSLARYAAVSLRRLLGRVSAGR